MQLLTKTPLNRCPVRYVKKWPTYQETGFSLYYVFKMKKSQNVKDFVKIEGRERGKVECVFPMVVVSILPHAEFGPNDCMLTHDHRDGAPHLNYQGVCGTQFSVKKF